MYRNDIAVIIVGVLILAPLLARLIWLIIIAIGTLVDYYQLLLLAKKINKAAPEDIESLLNNTNKISNYKNQVIFTNHLKKLKNSVVYDKLCELTLKDHALAKQLTWKGNFIPSTPLEQANFYYKTQKWEKLDALDPDGKLLQQTYSNSLREFQAEFLQNARVSGRDDLAKIVSRAKSNYTELHSQAEIERLVATQQWVELWQAVLNSSPENGVQILQRLVTSGWQPTEVAEQTVFLQLLDLSFSCQKIVGLGQLSRVVKSFTVTPPPLQSSLSSQPAIAISSDARLLAVPREDKIEIYEIANNRRLATIAIPLPPEHVYRSNPNAEKVGLPGSLTFSPDGKWLAYQQTIESYEPAVDADPFDGPDLIGWEMLGKINLDQSGEATNKNWESYIGNDGYVFLTNSTLFAIHCAHKTQAYTKHTRNLHFTITDLNTNKTLFSMNMPPLVDISVVVASSDGQTIAGQAGHERIWVWQVAQNKLSFINDQIASRQREEMQFSPDNKFIAYLTWAGVNLIDVTQTKVTYRLHNPLFENSTCLAFSPDSRVVAVAYSQPDAILLWDLNRPDNPVQLPLSSNNTQIISGLRFTPDGNSLVAVNNAGEVQTWESCLITICNRPPMQNSPEDLVWLQKVRLKTTGLSSEEKAWLEYCEILLKWRWRHEILVDNWQEVIANQTDIEI